MNPDDATMVMKAVAGSTPKSLVASHMQLPNAKCVKSGEFRLDQRGERWVHEDPRQGEQLRRDGCSDSGPGAGSLRTVPSPSC